MSNSLEDILTNAILEMFADAFVMERQKAIQRGDLNTALFASFLEQLFRSGIKK